MYFRLRLLRSGSTRAASSQLHVGPERLLSNVVQDLPLKPGGNSELLCAALASLGLRVFAWLPSKEAMSCSKQANVDAF
eukprot:1711575-Amphidinium_carterae.1